MPAILGIITDPPELVCAYECAVLRVFPVRSIPEDPEGFGMLAIEAAAHGLPAVVFAAGGILDAVAPDRSGKLVPSEDYKTLRDTIAQTLEDEESAWKTGSRMSDGNSVWPNFGLELSVALELPPHPIPGSAPR